MALHSQYIIDVLNSFDELKEGLELLQTAVCQQDVTLPSWFQPPPQLYLSEQKTTRDKTMAFLGQIEYLNDQQPREILIGVGVVAANDSTLKIVQEVNERKNQFKQAILTLKKRNISLAHPELNQYFEKTLDKRPLHMTHTLRKMGLARLHLKQCYRRIPCLVRRPLKVSWFWAHTKAIKRITVREAEQLLLEKGRRQDVSYQLSKLNTISEQEPLAIVQTLAPHLRANIVYPDGKGTLRSMVKGSMPLFYPVEDVALPELHPPEEKHTRDETRPIRSDVQLESKPFLPAIWGYRYLRK